MKLDNVLNLTMELWKEVDDARCRGSDYTQDQIVHEYSQGEVIHQD